MYVCIYINHGSNNKLNIRVSKNCCSVQLYGIYKYNYYLVISPNTVLLLGVRLYIIIIVYIYITREDIYSSDLGPQP